MNSQTATLCHSSDEVLEQLLEEITGRIQAGEMIAVEDYTAAHPEYADRLRRVLPAMQALVAFGRSQSSATRSPPASSIGHPASNSGVLGDFRIFRELGRGGMGVVYEAEQISIGRPVALKVLPFASMLDDKRLARFRNEIRAAGQLHHSNIVPIYAVGADRGVHFYAMQLVVGETLAQVVEELRTKCRSGVDQKGSSGIEPQRSRYSTTPLPHSRASVDTECAALSTLRSTNGPAFFRTAARLAIQAAEALEHAHTSGIVHRDIKPSNLLVDQRGNLWLTDFGLASIDSGSDLTMSGDLLGTLRYMSPEQTLGSRVVLDHRTDIYSLGVTLYELLTLQPAFDAADRGELLRQIAVVEPRPPRRLDPTIPHDLETIVLKAISKDAAGRYATAQNLADDLRRFLENKPIKARRPSLVDRGRKWAARHVALVAIAAGSLAIVATVAAAATFFTHRAYKAEARERAAAEANLAVASQIIDRMLSQASDHRYFHGDLARAETLAADATKYYDQLLQRSDDPDLQFRAAQAHGDVAHIWQLVGRHEKASIAARRAGELLQRLTTRFPGERRYLAALAANYNQIGLVDWSLDRPLAAEPPFRQAWEIWTELAERFPNEATYQDGVADMLANLGSVCYFTDRFDEAQEYYRRAEAIREHLPEDLKTSAAGLASQAGSLTNQAELARLRGQYDQALALLEQSIPLHKESLAKWSTNPVALDCYCHTLWNIGECNLGAAHPAEASAAVEQLVAEFPNRLSAYHLGAMQLLRCATQARGRAPFAESAEQKVPVPLSGPAVPGDDGNPTAGQASSATQAEVYRRRAHELVAKAADARQRTPDTVDRFAWFLLTCEDQSFRDPSQALELAQSVVNDVPERGEAWLTLALAHYRSGDWQFADEALHHSMKLARDSDAKAYNSLLMAMIRAQQGRTDEARQWYRKVDSWITQNKTDDEDLMSLAAEAGELIPDPLTPKT